MGLLCFRLLSKCGTEYWGKSFNINVNETNKWLSHLEIILKRYAGDSFEIKEYT